MKVIWKEETDLTTNRQETILIALLVDSYEQSGIPNYKVIATLGQVKKRFITFSIPATREFHQGIFWATVDKTLKHFRFSLAEKREIYNAISKKIPRPSGDWALWGVTCVPKILP